MTFIALPETELNNSNWLITTLNIEGRFLKYSIGLVIMLEELHLAELKL